MIGYIGLWIVVSMFVIALIRAHVFGGMHAAAEMTYIGWAGLLILVLHLFK